jgi:transcriptional regulator with XRE-family HTH domain
MSAATSSSTQASAAEAGAAVDAAAPDVGLRVRSLRESMDFSLRELALRSGVSAPMLSQVERGEASPTLAVAAKIAAGLELSLSQLLRLDEDRHLVIVPSGERRASRRGKHRVEELTPPLPGQRADVSLHTLESGGATGGPDDPPMHEPGSRETVYVQSGSVELVIDGESHTLGEGDSATFDADLAHHFENPGKARATMVAVVAAGLRRG